MSVGRYSINSVNCGDSAELLKALPDECIDLTVTSPPYDTLRTYNGYTFNFEAIAVQLWRVTKQGGVVVWVVDDCKKDGGESATSMRQALYFIDSCGFLLHDKMIYNPLNGAMGAKDEYLQAFEMMFVFSKGKPKTYNILRDRKNVRSGKETALKHGRNKDGRLPGRTSVELLEFGRRTNIWSYGVGGVKEFGNHPAIFPEQLAADHILSWSNPGDLVLDPMCGSGTTLKMAKILERNFIGFDISYGYVELSRRRVASVSEPMPLFSQSATQHGLQATWLPPEPEGVE